MPFLTEYLSHAKGRRQNLWKPWGWVWLQRGWVWWERWRPWQGWWTFRGRQGRRTRLSGDFAKTFSSIFPPFAQRKLDCPCFTHLLTYLHRNGHVQTFEGQCGSHASFPSRESCQRRAFLYVQDYGPPEQVVEAGVFLHPCEGEAVCKLTNEKVRQADHPSILVLVCTSCVGLH